jgi:choice-of-anchor C domain-containing protein
MMKTFARASGVIALALAMGGAAHAANLVDDGTFDSPFGGPTFTTFGAGTSFGPWSVTSGSVDLIGGYWQAPAGTTGSVDLDGNSPGGISQSISTGTGTYMLSFDLSGNPDEGPTTKTLEVSVGGVTQTYTYMIGANSHADMMYTPETLTFTASGPTTLTFTSLDVNSPSGPVIGDVAISAVPEPASWALMVLGLGAMGGALRSSRARMTGLAGA